MCKFLSGQNMGPRKKRRFFNSIIFTYNRLVKLKHISIFTYNKLVKLNHISIFTYNRLVKLNHISIFKLICIKPHIIVTRYSILYKVQYIQGIQYIHGIIYTRNSLYKVQYIQGIVFKLLKYCFTSNSIHYLLFFYFK